MPTTDLGAVKAALAKIGAVAADNGFSFFNGKQSVYLPVAENLKFAVVAGNGQVDLKHGPAEEGNLTDASSGTAWACSRSTV